MANIGVVLNENDSIIRNYINIDTDILNKNSSIGTSALHIAEQNLSASEKNQIQFNIGVQSLFSNALKKTDASLSTSEKNQILSNLGIQSVKNIVILTEAPDDSYGNDNDIVIKLSNYVPKMNERYLTFEALGSGSFSFSKDDANNDIYYRKNEGTWEVYSSSISVNEGDIVEWKGSLVSTPDSSKGIGTFSSTCNFNTYGNIMSLLYNDNFINKFDLSEYLFAFKNLFANNTYLINTNNLILPATTLANYCYNYMFRNCTGLTTAPELPATILAYSCYDGMFSICTSLTTAPELPATTLAINCYNYMFSGCTGLTTAPELPATTLVNYCYEYMFSDCTSLTTAPTLPATTLANYCYLNMFAGCTSLTMAPELPATTLQIYCYGYMFYDCTGLTTAPELPATTLASNCYRNMFSGCTSLTTAPTLPATTLVSYCYRYMFEGCSSLNYIKALFTTTPGSGYTDNWVNGVAASGMFVKSPNASWDVTGVHGIPTGWIIIYDVNNPEVEYLTFIALESGTFSFSKAGLSYSLDNGATWTALAAGASTPTIAAGKTVMWKNNTTLTPSSEDGIGTFSSTGNFYAYGNIMSLYYGDNFSEQTDLNGKPYAFKNLFQNCAKMINAENLILPATTLADYCYSWMFLECTGLITVPKLPATTLEDHCYYSMFYGCTGLTTAPELPATTLNSLCYSGMFYGCTGLTTAPELPATTLVGDCYAAMFRGCTSLITAPELPATTLAVICYGNMFKDCTGLTTAPELPATTLATGCYAGMFENCTGLTVAPELPATTLNSLCYSGMFENCTGLTVAPELPATTLAAYCYNGMFNGCSSLNYIKALFITTPGPNYTYNWVNGVAASGMFVKSDDATWALTGNHGVPSGWTIMPEYESEYLTFEAVTPCSFTFIYNYDSSEYLYYSIDNGKTWEPLISGNYTPTINAGDKILWKCNSSLSSGNYDTNIGTFNSIGEYNVEGNIMSLLYGDNFIGQNELAGNYVFAWLFSYTDPETGNLVGTNIIDASKLVLPATTLSNNCYKGMFAGCSSLITAPELPAIELVNGCYSQMFYECTSLISTPELPATVLDEGCYYNMFAGCESLVNAPKRLPATTLAYSCYMSMFSGCTSLTTAPELPATTLANNCYLYMFSGCISLEISPILPNATLAAQCYSNMFNGCTSLNTIICLIDTENIGYNNFDDYFDNWVYNVNDTGTFICNDETSASYWPIGVNGIPDNWVIKSIDNTANITQPWANISSDNYITVSNALYVSIHLSTNQTMYISKDHTNWKQMVSDTYYNTENSPVYICGYLSDNNTINKNNLSSSDFSYFKFIGNYIEVTGNCNSVWNYNNIDAPLKVGCGFGLFSFCDTMVTPPELPATVLANYCYTFMFGGAYDSNGNRGYCTSLQRAPELPAIVLADSCYGGMFYGCLSLVNAPKKLPAITLASECYAVMFYQCTSLITAPELSATTLADNCYSNMFYRCSSLNYIKALFTTTPGSTYTDNWVNGVSNFGIFIKNDDATWNLTGNNGVPSNWGIETYNIEGLRIWIDDFIWADYKLADIIEDPDHTIGSDCYTLTDETIQINNVTYCLWEGNNTGGDFKYLLTTSNDYNTLYNQSMEKDASNKFTSFYAYLDSDYVDKYYPSDPRQLIKIENNNGQLKIWVDDFWYEYNLSDWIDDPETHGCNPYELTGETAVFDNKAYYVWEYTGDSCAPPYLFTSTGDYDTLNNQSMKVNATNTFDSLYSFAWEDIDDLYNDSYVIRKQRLLKVEKI